MLENPGKTHTLSLPQRFPRIDVLINNAGIFDMMSKQRAETADGYETHLQVRKG